MKQALGLIETKGLIGAIEAADVMLKTASVTLEGLAKIGGGRVTISVRGDVGSINAAVQAGAVSAEQLGTLISSHIISGLHESVEKILPQLPVNKVDDLDKMSVVSLRTLARTLPNLKIKGRAISKANRETLLTQIRELTDKEGNV